MHPSAVAVSLLAASWALVASVHASSRKTSEPTILSVLTADDLEEDAPFLEDSSTADGSNDAPAASSTVGLVANNKIRIQDSRIVLSARDRSQLLQSIARAMVADQKKAIASATATGTATATDTVAVGTPLVPLTRDAFIYLKPATANATDALVVRLGWRYPLTVWSTYKAFVTTTGCDVQRVLGDYFYC